MQSDRGEKRQSRETVSLWRWKTAQLCFKQVVSLTLPSSSLLSFTLFMCVKTKAASLSAHEDTMRPEELVRGGVVVVVREAKKGVCVCVCWGAGGRTYCAGGGSNIGQRI